MSKKISSKKRQRIPLRLDEKLIGRLNKACEGSKKDFIENLLQDFIEKHSNGEPIVSYSGYGKSGQFVISVKPDIKDKVNDIADKNKSSVSDIVRSAFILWDVSQIKQD